MSDTGVLDPETKAASPDTDSGLADAAKNFSPEEQENFKNMTPPPEEEDETPPAEGGSSSGGGENDDDKKSGDKLDDAKKLKDHFGKNEPPKGESIKPEGDVGKSGGELGKGAGKEAGEAAKSGGKAVAKEGASAAAEEAGSGAATAAGTAAAEGGALAAAEGTTAAAGAATSETGVGALIAALIIAGIEALKLMAAAYKTLTSGNVEDFEKEALKWPKRILFISLIVFGVILIIVLIILFAFGSSDTEAKLEALNSASTLQITKTGPTSGVADQYLTYTIHAVSTVPTTNISIVDKIPANTQFFKADNKGVFSATDNSVTWDSENTSNPSDATFTLVVRVDHNVHNVSIVNVATGTSVGGGSASIASGYIPPAAATSCNGKYSSYISKNWILPQNYGDPVCSYTKEQQYALLKEKDPRFADLWFLTIVPGESGYNPNAWADPKKNGQCQIDCGGAWGLYQMGSTARVNKSTWTITSLAGQPPPAGGINGPLDRGDVNWETQTINAIQFNQNQHCIFRYWATATAFWYKYSC